MGDEVIKEDFLDEGEFMLCPGMVLGRKAFWHSRGTNDESKGTGVGHKAEVRLAGMGVGECIINYHPYRVFGQTRPTQGMLGLWVVGNSPCYGME